MGHISIVRELLNNGANVDTVREVGNHFLADHKVSDLSM